MAQDSESEGQPVPERVQLKRAKGWRMPPNTVSVARPHKFGNTYRVGSTQYVPGAGRVLVRDRAHAVALHRRNTLDVVAGAAFRETVRFELRGKNLACFCPIGQACHADVLLMIANEPATAGANG